MLLSSWLSSLSSLWTPWSHWGLVTGSVCSSTPGFGSLIWQNLPWWQICLYAKRPGAGGGIIAWILEGVKCQLPWHGDQNGQRRTLVSGHVASLIVRQLSQPATNISWSAYWEMNNWHRHKCLLTGIWWPHLNVNSFIRNSLLFKGPVPLMISTDSSFKHQGGWSILVSPILLHLHKNLLSEAIRRRMRWARHAPLFRKYREFLQMSPAVR